jgi:hypothetical protein
MSKGIIHTQAGDDSDGKIWGIEGMNIVFILAGLLLSIGTALMLARNHPATFSVGAGSLPFVFTTAYVFSLRQSRPKSFDTDLLETLANGTGWIPPQHQPRNPVYHNANT